MKNITTSLFTIALIIMGFSLQAQLMPAPSPSCETEQMVGMTEVTLEYSRPSMKGRTIFGDLVPYGEMWRTGANASTKVEFSTDVNLGGMDVPAGKYALYTTPGKDSWEVMLYKDLSLWGTPSEVKEEDVVGTFKVTPTKTKDTYESMSIYLDHLRNDMAHLVLVWENTKVAMELKVPTDEMVMANIEKTMAGPTGGQYYQAARYYLESGRDLKQAQTWIDKALEENDKAYWVMTVKARIHKAMGDKAGAKATAEKAIGLAKEAGNMGYVKQNEELINSL
jgi:hypothetical protein